MPFGTHRLQIGKRAICSSMLIRSNAPNRLLGAHLQRMLRGEYHETCFCTCWPRRARRRGTLQRSSVCDACRHSGTGRASFQRSAGRLLLQPMGPTAGANRPTPMVTATVTTIRIIMAAGVGTIAGAGTAGTITIAAGDTAGATGTDGNPEERGLGPFLFRRAAIPAIASADEREVLKELSATRDARLNRCQHR